MQNLLTKLVVLLQVACQLDNLFINQIDMRFWRQFKQYDCYVAHHNSASKITMLLFGAQLWCKSMTMTRTEDISTSHTPPES